MPLVSKAQWRKFGHMLDTGEISKEKFDEWAHSSPSYDSLPERKAKAAKTSSSKAKRPAVGKGRSSTVGRVGKTKKIGSTSPRAGYGRKRH